MDNINPKTITIETIDSAVNDWFDKTVDAKADHPSGEKRKVPVIFSSGERWATSRERKGVRDANGVLILPLISVRRTGIEPNQSMSAFGIQTPTLQFSKQISKKTNRMQNLNEARKTSERSVIKPVIYEVTTIPFPNSTILNYEVVIQAQYVTQMNEILEKMFHMVDIQNSFVMPFDNFGRQPLINVDPYDDRPPLKTPYVVGFFDSGMNDTGNFDEFTDQERIIRYSTTFTVNSVLQVDPDGTTPSMVTERTSFGLDFGDERVSFVDDPEDLEKIFGRHR